MAKDKSDKKLTSLASLWDDTDASEASNSLPEGTHTVRINKMELSEKPDKGTAVFAEYECLDGENEGKKGRQMYKLTDADGAKASGMAYLKRDLALLEYADVSGKKFAKVLTEITEAQPLVIIQVKNSGNYVNCFLQGLAEDDGAGSEGGDGGDADAEIEEGSTVTWTNDDGDEQEGVVESIDGDEAEIKVEGKKKPVTVDLVELTLKVDDSGGGEVDTDNAADPVIEVGSKVKFQDDDDEEKEGTVTKIKGDKVTIEDEDDEIFKRHLDDVTLVEADEAEAVELEAGDDVTFPDPANEDETLEGEIVSIKGDTAKVKVGKKTLTVDLSDLSKAE